MIVQLLRRFACVFFSRFPVVPLPFFFGGLFIKEPNIRRKGALIKGFLGNLVLWLFRDTSDTSGC